MPFSQTHWLWLAFAVAVVVMLALDLGVFHRRAHRVRPHEALAWSAAWIALALLFGGGIWWQLGRGPALSFYTAWLIEKSLSVDNLFVFVALFRAFAVPPPLQHRVLFWGILGALATRGVFIFAGVALIARFHWVLYLFGALLLLAAGKLLFGHRGPPRPERNLAVRLFRRLVPSVSELRGPHFMVKEGGRRLATPLLMSLVAIEATDVVFAADSIPAIFGVTTDPFLVYTSNIFAVLGLRALYSLLADAVERFRHLDTGVALVLAFVGLKLLLQPVIDVPPAVSLAVVAALLAGAIAASLLPPLAARRRPRYR